MSGRTIPDQRLRPGPPKRATVPACDLTLRDGRLLRYQGLGAPQVAGPNGETIRNIQEFCMQMWQTPVEWGLQ